MRESIYYGAETKTKSKEVNSVMCMYVLRVCMCCTSNSSLGYCFVSGCVSVCVEEGGEEEINEKET